ncbi:MAG: cobalamin biosynthesis protein [Myxococcales bacterium]
MPERKPFAIYAITVHGIGIGARLREALPAADLYVSEKLFSRAPEGALPLPLPLSPTLSRTFSAYDCHIFVISVGAVVRMIAPLLADKKQDPAVVCVDDAARFAICVLSGHVGRGNAFTDRVAAALGATSVVTTASDVRGTFTVDILGRELGWTLDDSDRNVTRGCAAVVNEAPVLFVQETGEPSFWPPGKPLPPGVRYARGLDGVDPRAFEMLLVVSDRDLRETHRAHFDNAVVYRPKSLVLGIGCDRGTALDLLERGVEALLTRHGLSAKSVKEVATIDKKADEPGLLALCERRRWPLRTFTAEELDGVAAPTPSETVRRHVGTRGVCEPAALLASGAPQLLVEKQIYTEPDAGRSMTLSVARIPFPSRSEVRDA